MEDKIQSELKAVQKKLEKIEKKQEMLQKIQNLDREHQKKMGERPSGHLHEMMQQYIIIILDRGVILRTYNENYG